MAIEKQDKPHRLMGQAIGFLLVVWLYGDPHG